jgi:hypothetical protein
MRIIRNERRIRTFKFIGQYASLGGLVVLLVGALFLSKPEQAPLLIGAMFVGFILSTVGGHFADRYIGPQAQHTALAKALKGLDDDYTLLDYTLPAPHVLVEPGGCTVLVVKTQKGKIRYEDGAWAEEQSHFLAEAGKLLRRVAGQQGLGGPDAEAEKQAHKLRERLEEQLPAVDVPVRGAIVFTHPDVYLRAANSPVPAFRGKEIKKWLRDEGRQKPLPDADYARLREVLGIEAQEPR